ncbi:DUF1361 domain-containing protein [Leuconostoc fallax]|uniref:DUF1361 domain-containing protein n=1 Tax=Leuconostoc fallax TaxID=1251 RepID=A0A4R5N872_9LACO|nr:DUF1361 domain-containing protein [Leuconostoc fallax]TDG67991.1 hypothetical protein C5L23_000297 [Leuconostoc fallax]
MKKPLIIIHSLIALFFIVIWLFPTVYNFLILNVCLALIPFDVSILIKYVPNRVIKFALGFIWLIFYPNTMYMITDFVHLYSIGTTVGAIRFNYAVLAMGIFIGVLLGMRSIEMIYETFVERDSLLWQGAFYGIFSLLSAYGMYLGRFLRLNSWEVLTNWRETFQIIISQMNMQSFEFVIIFGALQLALILIYQSLRRIN